jgi:hypothetical protein
MTRNSTGFGAFGESSAQRLRFTYNSMSFPIVVYLLRSDSRYKTGVGGGTAMIGEQFL